MRAWVDAEAGLSVGPRLRHKGLDRTLGRRTNHAQQSHAEVGSTVAEIQGAGYWAGQRLIELLGGAVERIARCTRDTRERLRELLQETGLLSVAVAVCH